MQEGCKLPSRHGHVTWFDTNAYVHGTPRLFRSPSCTRPLRHTGKQRLSAPSHQDKVTATVSLGHHGTVFTTELLQQGGGLLVPRTKCQHRCTPSRRVINVYTCLAMAKTSLKLALSRTKPIQVHKALSQSFSQARYGTKLF